MSRYSIGDKENLLQDIVSHHESHSTESPWFKNVNRKFIEEQSAFRESLRAGSLVHLGELGELSIPYYSFSDAEQGVDTTHLFGVNELIIFAFYYANRDRYSKVVDLGANVGVHSLVLSKLGFAVKAFEPDPIHFKMMAAAFSLNGCDAIDSYEAAVVPDGQSDLISFTRVKGNTTGSHISGAKAAPYGELELFQVAAVAFSTAIHSADLVKMDVEGLEAALFDSVSDEQLGATDFMLEVGTADAARAIYGRFATSSISMYSQKTGWQLCDSWDQLPTSHRQGSLFLTTRNEMPW